MMSRPFRRCERCKGKIYGKERKCAKCKRELYGDNAMTKHRFPRLINLDVLEEYIQVAKEFHKEFSIRNGKWAWYNQGEESLLAEDAWKFETFWDCLSDCVAPYVTPGPKAKEN